MNFYQISLGLVALINLFIGIFVLTRNVRDRVNRLFCIFTVFMTLWMITLFFLSLVPQENRSLAKACISLLHLSLVFLHSTYFHFVLGITNDQTRINKRLSYVAYLSSLIFLILGRIGLFDPDVIYCSPIGYYPVPGPANHFFHIVFLFFVSYGTYLLYQSYKKATSHLERNQYRYLFFGMAIILLFSISNILRVMGVNVYPAAHIGILVFNCMTAIAIVRYHLMDIDIVIRPTIVYTSLTALVTTLWLGSILVFENLLHFAPFASRILGIILIIFVFNILRDKIQYAVDKLFFRERQNLAELQEKVTKDIVYSLDPDLIAPTVMKTIYENIHPEFVSIMLPSANKKFYEIRYMMGEGDKLVVLPINHPLARWLAKEKREIFLEEPEENPYFGRMKKEVKRGIERVKARLVIPMIIKDDLIGIISLGEKRGERKAFSFAEIGFLNTVARELAIALENTKLYAELKKRTEELAEANKVKSEFLSIVSHELNTPLAVIMGEIDLLQSELSRKKLNTYKERLNIMRERGVRLSRLIKDILNMAAIEKGEEYKIEKRRVNVKRVVEKTILNFRLIASHKNIEITTDIEKRIALISDPKKIEEILYRLIDNAIKFTPPGGRVTISANDRNGYVGFCVEDTGIGIKKEFTEKIFERFFQIDASDTRKYTGAGLGLSVAKELVKVLEGEIWVDSKVGEGSRFFFTVKKL